MELRRDGRPAAAPFVLPLAGPGAIALADGHIVRFQKDGTVLAVGPSHPEGVRLGYRKVISPSVFFRPPAKVLVLDRATWEISRFFLNGDPGGTVMPHHRLIDESRAFFAAKQERARSAGAPASGRADVTYLLTGCTGITPAGQLLAMVSPVLRQQGAVFLELSETGEVLHEFAIEMLDRSTQPRLPSWIVWYKESHFLVYSNGAIAELSAEAQ